MKTNYSIAVVLLCLSTLNPQLSTLFAQGSAFTYQGRLSDTGAPANGSYSVRFILYNAEFGGSQVGPTLTNEPVTVADGVFTTTLDFGAAVLDGSPRWLEVALRTNGSAAAHLALSPRQALGTAPYAFRAARLTGTLPDSQLSPNIPRLNGDGTFIGTVTFDPRSGPPFAVGNSEVVTKLNADLLDGMNAADFAPAGHNHDTTYWKLTGNAGANPTNGVFLGTADNLPLEFRVNNRRVWRAEPSGSSVPNIIGGASGNAITNARGSAILSGGESSGAANRIGDENFPVSSSVIVGGTANRISDDNSFIGGGAANLVEARFSAIAGGFRNRCDGIGRFSFIGGGQTNYIDSEFCFIGGGTNNQIDTFSSHSTIAGGRDNLIDAFATNSVISGGWSNVVDLQASFAMIPGGEFNLVDGKYGFAAGRRAKVRHQGTFIWADSTDADFASTGNNQFLIRANNGVGVNVAQPRGDLHVGAPGSAAPLNAASQTIIVENAGENGRAAFLALAGPGASSSSNRVELELEANENERRAIIGTTSDHEIQIRQNNTTRITVEVGGNVGINTGNPTERLHVSGNILATGTITPNSDRNAKTDIEPVDSAAILDRVAALPIRQWRFKAEADGVKHVGPMAQDFHAAFGLGAHETAIATVDADGVALAAIQGLNEKVDRLNNELNRRDTENALLRRRVELLERLVGQLSTQ